jgi:flagella basal body P-ring formation protein FlgA
LIIAAATVGLATAECHSVSEPRILGRHLALADSRLAFIPAEAIIAYTPAPGVSRIFLPSELSRIAQRWQGKSLPAAPLCFIYPVYPLDPKELAAAIRQATGADEVEVVEHSRFPAPNGAIEFQPAASGRPAADGSRIFRGGVRYSGTRTQIIWTRAICRYRTRRVVAAAAIAAGDPIRARDIELREAYTTEKDSAAATRPEEVIGRAATRPIAAGAAIYPKLLRIPPSVERGDRVRVEVRSGRARISLDTVAESPGRNGEHVLLRDNVSGRRFRASVAGPGAAVLDASGKRGEERQ